MQKAITGRLTRKRKHDYDNLVASQESNSSNEIAAKNSTRKMRTDVKKGATTNKRLSLAQQLSKKQPLQESNSSNDFAAKNSPSKMRIVNKKVSSTNRFLAQQISKKQPSGSPNAKAPARSPSKMLIQKRDAQMTYAQHLSWLEQKSPGDEPPKGHDLFQIAFMREKKICTKVENKKNKMHTFMQDALERYNERFIDFINQEEQTKKDRLQSIMEQMVEYHEAAVNNYLAVKEQSSQLMTVLENHRKFAKNLKEKEAENTAALQMIINEISKELEKSEDDGGQISKMMQEMSAEMEVGFEELCEENTRIMQEKMKRIMSSLND